MAVMGAKKQAIDHNGVGIGLPTTTAPVVVPLRDAFFAVTFRPPAVSWRESKGLHI